MTRDATPIDRGVLAACYDEGYQAASQQKSFSEYCPYTFNKSGLSLSHDGQFEFDCNWRPKMDAWFKGWKVWLDERGLGNNFEPTKNKKDKK